MKEPCVLVPASDLIELIEAWEKQKKNYSLKCSDKFAWYYQQAFKNLRRFNRRTMQDS